jgi:hypothetical protein
MGRSPLAVRYDPAAARFVTRILGAWDGRARDGRWVETTVTGPSARLIGWALSRGIDPERIRYTGRGSGIETANEAAFRQAVYFDGRVRLWDRSGSGWGEYDPGRPRNPGRVAALEFRWGRRTAAGRVARARAHPVESASRYARRERPYYHGRG